MFKLYDYFRSSAGFRVRIALNLKGLPYERIPIHLLKDGGEQFQESYIQRNAQKLVPSLEIVETGDILTQSLAIIEYLDEVYALPKLLPENKQLRANIRSIALAIACDIHPLNNLRVLKYLKHELDISDDQKDAWYTHWIVQGFNAIERLVNTQGPYCFGSEPTLADVCLIPQVYNAQRYGVSLGAYPQIEQIYTHCLTQSAFKQALPENQTDAS